MIDIGAVTHVLTTNSVCLMRLIIALKMEEFEFVDALHSIQLTKNHANKLIFFYKNGFSNNYKTVCVKSIILQ